MSEYVNNEDLQSNQNKDSIEIFFDTETTGRSYKTAGIVDIGLIKRIGGPKGSIETLQFYFKNKSSDVWEMEAQKVHGLTQEFLADKPYFEEKAQEIVDFISGAEMIAHNADFDIDFLNKELLRAGFDNIYNYIVKVKDTLKMSTLVRAGKKHGLNFLADDLKVDRSARNEYHGALIDASLLPPIHDQLKVMIEEKGEVDYESDIPRKPVDKIPNLGNFKIPTIILSEEDRKANEDILNDMEKETKVTPIAKQTSAKVEEPQEQPKPKEENKYKMI